MASLDITLRPVWNTERGQITFNLVQWAGIYPFAGAIFRGQVRDDFGAVLVRYEWLTGGSPLYPNSRIFYDEHTHLLVLHAPSEDMRACFPPELVAQQRGQFAWEVGFYLPMEPKNFTAIGQGVFPVNDGVIRQGAVA